MKTRLKTRTDGGFIGDISIVMFILLLVVALTVILFFVFNAVYSAAMDDERDSCLSRHPNAHWLAHVSVSPTKSSFCLDRKPESVSGTSSFIDLDTGLTWIFPTQNVILQQIRFYALPAKPQPTSRR